MVSLLLGDYNFSGFIGGLEVEVHLGYFSHFRIIITLRTKREREYHNRLITITFLYIAIECHFSLFIPFDLGIIIESVNRHFHRTCRMNIL